MQTIGERLEEARKRKGVSIREAAEATKIRGDYLHKFENNQFDLTLPEIYVRGFLRTYAVFLKLPGDKIVNDYKGLGLGEPKPRGINRESFGRMDLSVATAKSANREPPPPSSSSTPAEGVAVDGAPAENNPATFRPRAGAGPQIDRTLIIKGALALAALGALVLLIFLVAKLFSGDSNRTANSSSSQGHATVQPRSGEATFTVTASDKVFVTVRMREEGTVLFSGTMARGEKRVVPRRGTVRIDADPFRAVEFQIDGKLAKMSESPMDLPAP